MPSTVQVTAWDWWQEFWDEWVPTVTRNEPFVVVHNGDAVEGVPHGSTSGISNNPQDQQRIGEEVLRPFVSRGVRYYHIRGTEAHVGKSGCDEEALAKSLGAHPDGDGRHARWDLWLSLCGELVHAMHHIGTTGSAAYESTAITKELTEEYTEAARWSEKPPAVIVRSHRHRNYEVRCPTAFGHGIAFVTAGWQLKTPFSWKIAGGRLSQPQFGGSVVRVSDEGEIYTRHYTKSIGRSRVEEA